MQLKNCIIENWCQFGATDNKNPLKQWVFWYMEQTAGIEPVYSAWEADILPLNYACMLSYYTLEVKNTEDGNIIVL